MKVIHIYPQKRNVITSIVGLETVTYAKLSPKMVNPSHIAGNTGEEEEEEEEEGEGEEE